MTCSASEYLSAVKWAEESFAPKDFAKTTLLPQVGKIIKGQFQEQGLGVPTTACPSLNQTIFWTRVVKRVKVIAQCVKFKDLKGGSLPRSIAFGPRLEIYDDYNGWFEILSEDGRSVKVMESISEVAKRMPRKFLIREAIKVNLGKKVDEEEFLSEKTRVIPSGEVLSLATIGSFCSKNPSDKYLKCFTSEGEVLFMRLDAKGKFSAVASEESISGVHSIKNLSSKRLPLMGRLVHGSWPSSSSFKAFEHTMRILSVQEEDFLLGIPLLKHSDSLLQLPLSSSSSCNMRIVPPKNASFLQSLTQYTSLIEKASHASPLERHIQVIGSPCVVEESSLNGPAVESFTHYDHKKRFASNSILVRKCIIPTKEVTVVTAASPSESSCRLHHHQDMNNQNVQSSSPAKSQNSQVDSCCFSDSASSSSSNDSAYEEIDQIYDYIRGFAPLPETVKKELQRTNQATNQATNAPSTPANPNHHHIQQHHRNDDYHSPRQLAFKKNNLTNFHSHRYHSIPDSRRLSYPTKADREVSLEDHATLKAPAFPAVAASGKESNNSQSPPHTYPQHYHHHPRVSAVTVHLDKRPLRSNSVGRIPSQGDDRGLLRKFEQSSHYHHQGNPGNNMTSSSHRKSPQDESSCHYLHQSCHDHPPSHQPHHHLPASPSKKLFVKRSSTAGLKSSSRGYHMLRYSSSAKQIPVASLEDSSGNRHFANNHNKLPVTQVDSFINNFNNNNDNIIANNDVSGGHNPCLGNNGSNNCCMNSRRSVVTSSPIFNIRYKSLNNINMVPSAGSPPHPSCQVLGGNHDSNGTLDSNNSSGKKTNSTGSKGGSPIYESLKKSKKLSKPKSLNNIFREIATVFSSFEDRKSSDNDCSSSSCDRNNSSSGSLVNNRPSCGYFDMKVDTNNLKNIIIMRDNLPMNLRSKAVYM